MPYIIAFVIIIVAAGALLLFRQPAEEPITTNTDVTVEEATDIQPESQNNAPEGFTSPTAPPPTTTVEQEKVSAEPVQDEEVVEQQTEATTQPEAAAEADTAETYTAEASYFTPNRTEHEMEVTLELEGEIIVGANVAYNDGAA